MQRVKNIFNSTIYTFLYHKLRKSILFLILSSGILFLIVSILAFTSLPYNLREWLATKEGIYSFKPKYSIMLGGSGMPSEDNLIRLYYTAEAANRYPKSKVIIAHPLDSLVQIKMKYELILRGLDSTRIMFEEKGINTRSQVLNILDTFPETIKSECIVVTCPEQMLRSIKSFRKAGIKKVGGYPAYPCDMYVNLKYKTKKLKGLKYIPDVGNSLSLRYNYWNYLKLEITCIREFFALFYYKINGWI